MTLLALLAGSMGTSAAYASTPNGIDTPAGNLTLPLSVAGVAGVTFNSTGAGATPSATFAGQVYFLGPITEGTTTLSVDGDMEMNNRLWFTGGNTPNPITGTPYTPGLNIDNTVFLSTGGLNINNRAVVNTGGVALDSSPGVSTIFLDAATGNASFTGTMWLTDGNLSVDNPTHTSIFCLNGKCSANMAAQNCHIVTATSTGGTEVSDARCASNEYVMSGGGIANHWTGSGSICQSGDPNRDNLGFIHTNVPDGDLQGWSIDAITADNSGEVCTSAWAICCPR